MHNAVRFPSSVRLRRWSLPLAAALLMIPALLAACATENTSSETVIVTAEMPEGVVVEEIEKVNAMEEALARIEMERAFAEQRLAIEEAERLYRNAVERLNEVHERGQALEKGQKEKLYVERAEKLQSAQAQRDRMLEKKFTKTEFKRLAVQMEYLQREIEKISSDIEQKTGPEQDMIYQRVNLLNVMYMQRLEKYETMKMEQFTEEALSNGEL